MTRLARYLAKSFAIETLSFFLVAVFLVWITQALRLFDLVTAKGQDMLTLLGQATLTTPSLARIIIYICMGIGLARALRALQTSRELHAIHAGKRTSALWAAVAGFTLAGALAVSFMANWLEPQTKRIYANWSEQVAADLVGRALNPHRFSEVVPGLIVVIGGREPDGTVINFFADDSRTPGTRRTYIAKSAIIVFDDEGYHINLKEGAVQYMREHGQFTEVGFNSYGLSLGRLIETGDGAQALEFLDTGELIRRELSQGGISDAAWWVINERFSETLRVIAICLLTTALAAFPHARRGRDWLPLEVVILIVGLGERAFSAIIAPGSPAGSSTGVLILGAVATAIFLVRLYGHRLVFIRRTA